MTCRMEWTAPDGSQHRCVGARVHDGIHECGCGAAFTLTPLPRSDAS